MDRGCRVCRQYGDLSGGGALRRIGAQRMGTDETEKKCRRNGRRSRSGVTTSTTRRCRCGGLHSRRYTLRSLWLLRRPRMRSTLQAKSSTSHGHTRATDFALLLGLYSALFLHRVSSSLYAVRQAQTHLTNDGFSAQGICQCLVNTLVEID